MTEIQGKVSEDFKSMLKDKIFPCVAAKAALVKDQLKIMTAGHMGCPKDDKAILEFIYDFLEGYRNSDKLFHSAVIIFPNTEIFNEDMYEKLFWSRLQALADADAKKYNYDIKVSPNPDSKNFSFSLGEEAFFIIGLHPASSRKARQFKYPAIVFNPHAQFEKLRENKQYIKIKNIVRKKDFVLSGSINPMLQDFGEASEVYQYTGRHYTNNWKCPFNSNHNKINNENNKSA
ncbi:YqcI/YcgG family protein [Flavobacterium arcticum]|uniref:YqcI/YcgG family protein n=1 Tax=Flavobacterium arcticum TaxID=1784713 RepID=A0A345HF22_9FLAO|nr:guanitoxin biosynthesis heme-dependent pre-guanitoxin N-hydroxylase GntA [Flavobacterium arcticum]AXG75182.1 YqcI/YcgG family protein [Flavobacterium arcticum]KAF2511036.1 YqcI/YcgG family protein [Flavobacterium arcticum]